MKPLALLLALSLPADAAPDRLAASGAAVAVSTETGYAAPPIRVTAPHPLSPEEIRALRVARAGGAGAGAAGAGLMAYALAFDVAGPFGWAASLIFLGGMTAYLSHRRLHGRNDLTPNLPSPKAATEPSPAPEP